MLEGELDVLRGKHVGMRPFLFKKNSWFKDLGLSMLEQDRGEIIEHHERIRKSNWQAMCVFLTMSNVSWEDTLHNTSANV